jgi:hypothetical protein
VGSGKEPRSHEQASQRTALDAVAQGWRRDPHRDIFAII